MTEKGISREELAKRVKLTTTTITNICQEDNYPKIKTLPKFAKALGVDIRELFISTQGTAITDNEVAEAKELIEKGLNILNGKR